MSAHPSIAEFAVAGDCLAVGGVALDRLAERVGGTPFFAYDRQLITSRVAYLRSVLPAAVKLSYAVKANPMPAVVQHLSGLVDALDVASALEMKVALDTPVPPSQVSFAGPGKTTAELTQDAHQRRLIRDVFKRGLQPAGIVPPLVRLRRCVLKLRQPVRVDGNAFLHKITEDEHAFRLLA